MQGLEDYAFWLTLMEHGHEGAQIPEILGAYRAHPSGRTRSMLLHLDAIHARLERAFPWLRLRAAAPAPSGGEQVQAPQDSAERYMDLMIRILANTIYEDPSMQPGDPAAFDGARRVEGRDWLAQAHSMAGTARLRNLAQLVDRTLRENIPGDYIETGVWRGGCCILIAIRRGFSSGLCAAYFSQRWVTSSESLCQSSRTLSIFCLVFRYA